MNSIKYYALGMTLVSGLALTGCAGDYLDTVPSNFAAESTISATVNGWYSALNGIHKEMVSQESGYQCLGGEPGIMVCRDCEADDIIWQKDAWMKAAYLGWQCNMDANSGYNGTIWRLYYQWIMNSNKILAGLKDITPDVNNQKLYNQVKGEALCIRAWAHFNLVQLYANRYVKGEPNDQDGIPYREEPKANAMARNSVATVYTKIDADLTEATQLLDGIKVKDVNHYSSKVAYGLRARVALAMQDYKNAATYAKQAIELAEKENGKLMTGDQLNCGFANFTSDTNETMYAAMTPDDKSVYFYSYYAYMSWNFNSGAIRGGVKCINAETYNSMSETDLRRAWWDPSGKADVPSSTYTPNQYQNRKFRARSTANPVGDVAFMRLAEMYLTEAEALARDGQVPEAQVVFTKFQQTRDPKYVSNNANQDGLIEEIMNSRRVELWGEGFRFFDLKRLNLPIKRGSNFDKSFCTFTEKSADADGWTWEIPKAETDYNPLCKTNY